MRFGIRDLRRFRPLLFPLLLVDSLIGAILSFDRAETMERENI